MSEDGLSPLNTDQAISHVGGFHKYQLLASVIMFLMFALSG